MKAELLILNYKLGIAERLPDCSGTPLKVCVRVLSSHFQQNVEKEYSGKHGGVQA